MSNFSVKINLLRLHKAGIINIQGKTGVKRCVVIPVDDNDIFIGMTENKPKSAYINAMMWENRNPDTHLPEDDSFGNSHRLRLEVGKDMREKLTQDELKAMQVIFGNASVFKSTQGNINVPTVNVSDNDDMPF